MSVAECYLIFYNTDFLQKDHSSIDYLKLKGPIRIIRSNYMYKFIYMPKCIYMYMGYKCIHAYLLSHTKSILHWCLHCVCSVQYFNLSWTWYTGFMWVRFQGRLVWICLFAFFFSLAMMRAKTLVWSCDTKLQESQSSEAGHKI